VRIVSDFRTDQAAAKQKYKGQAVRLKLEKIVEVSELPRGVFVHGQVGKIVIWATFPDAAEGKKALALKVGEPATLAGEVIGVTSDLPAVGLITMEPAKVVP
jgi:hypothetical protein